MKELEFNFSKSNCQKKYKLGSKKKTKTHGLLVFFHNLKKAKAIKKLSIK